MTNLPTAHLSAAKQQLECLEVAATHVAHQASQAGYTILCAIPEADGSIFLSLYRGYYETNLTFCMNLKYNISTRKYEISIEKKLTQEDEGEIGKIRVTKVYNTFEDFKFKDFKRFLDEAEKQFNNALFQPKRK